jgi:transcriptional regulator with XRE-family HTH domain
MNIGLIIREIRLAKGLTLEEVAYGAGTDGGNLSRIERGLQRSIPELLERIAATLGVTVSELYQRVEAGREDRCSQVKEIKASYTVAPAEPQAAAYEALLAKYKKLSEPNQNLVIEFIQLLLRQQKHK